MPKSSLRRVIAITLFIVLVTALGITRESLGAMGLSLRMQISLSLVIGVALAVFSEAERLRQSVGWVLLVMPTALAVLIGLVFLVVPADAGPAPATLRLGAVTSDSVHLEWTPSKDDAHVREYQLWRYADGTPQASVRVMSGLSNTFDDGNLKPPGARLHYYVIAVGLNGLSSPHSAEVIAELPYPPLRQPTDLHAVQLGSTSIILGWSPVATAVSYVLVRDGGEIGSVTGTQYADTGLQPDTSYRYTVRARDVWQQWSEPSAQITLRTLVPDGPAAPPIVITPPVHAAMQIKPSAGTAFTTTYTIIGSGWKSGQEIKLFIGGVGVSEDLCLTTVARARADGTLYDTSTGGPVYFNKEPRGRVQVRGVDCNGATQDFPLSFTGVYTITARAANGAEAWTQLTITGE